MSDLKVAQTTWNLNPLFQSDTDPDIQVDRTKLQEEIENFAKKWRERDDYLQDTNALKEALDDFNALQTKYGITGDSAYYFELRQVQDQNEPAIKAEANKSDELSTQLKNQIEFFTLNLSKVSKETQATFLNAPELLEYKHYLEQLFAFSPYLLSEAEEKILNLKSLPSFGNWVKMTSSLIAKEQRKVFDEEEKEITAPFALIMSLINSKNKKVRDTAVVAFNDIMLKNADVAENEMNSILLNKKIDDTLRHVERPDKTRHLSDDIDSEAVDTLVEAVSDRFDLARRYYELKAKLMGVPRLAYHERNVEYGEIDQNYTYEQAVNLVNSVFTNLDNDFAQIFARFVRDSQIDVYPKVGKRSGAACYGNLISQPTYIYLNYTDKLNDVLTLAHEVGHGINNELMRGKQNALNFGSPLSTAEVASTFMEDFVLQELLSRSNEEERLALSVAKLNDDISTIMRQIAAYQFELELHTKFREKGYLSKEEIGEIFQKHMRDYMGDFVEQPEEAKSWWVYWQHFRMFFYVYSYSSGLLISKSLQKSVKEDHTFIEKVKGFLSAGTSESPKDIFMKLGIDITQKAFWDKGIDEIEALLDETEELAKKLGKIS